MRVAAAAIVWEFLISEESRLEFESIYGPGGPWAELFRQSPNYLGTELLRDLSRPGRYLTIDRWISREALHGFKQDHAAAYAALDAQCETLTEAETNLGDFEIMAPAGR